MVDHVCMFSFVFGPLEAFAFVLFFPRPLLCSLGDGL